MFCFASTHDSAYPTVGLQSLPEHLKKIKKKSAWLEERKT